MKHKLLIFLFLLAVFMGAGPGLYLINPDIAEPTATYTSLGLPVIYLLVLCCYAVQFGVILYAYLHLWREDDDG